MGRDAVFSSLSRYVTIAMTSAIILCMGIGAANACRRTSFPICAQLFAAGNNCVRLVNNCSFAVRWHENLRRCTDETHWLQANHQTVICGNNCTLRGVTMC